MQRGDGGRSTLLRQYSSVEKPPHADGDRYGDAAGRGVVRAVLGRDIFQASGNDVDGGRDEQSGDHDYWQYFSHGNLLYHC